MDSTGSGDDKPKPGAGPKNLIPKTGTIKLPHAPASPDTSQTKLVDPANPTIHQPHIKPPPLPSPISIPKSPLVQVPVPLKIQHQLLDFRWPFPDFNKPHGLWRFKSKIAVFVVGWWGRAVLNWMNNTKILNKDRLTDAIFNRSPGTPLITVANHESCIDDPSVLAAFFTQRQFLDIDKLRWALGAHDICYRIRWEGYVMALGKTTPCVRGLGIYQKAMDFAIERLNLGDWIHVFPEGRVNMEREGLYRLKWGIGRLISESKEVPIIIPFWHTGMPEILPNYPPYYPRWGKNILINVGQPIDIRPVLDSVKDSTALQKRKIITDYIQDKLVQLRQETLILSQEQFKSNRNQSKK